MTNSSRSTYQWLYAKMSALPLNEVLGDFEDAILHIKDPAARKEINLVADSIRWSIRRIVDKTD